MDFTDKTHKAGCEEIISGMIGFFRSRAIGTKLSLDRPASPLDHVGALREVFNYRISMPINSMS